MLATIQNSKVRWTTQANPNWQPIENQSLQSARSNSDSSNLLQLSVLIPQHYVPVPFLADLMLRYDVDVNIVAAGLNIDEEGNNWLKISLNGSNQELVRVLNYLGSLKILCKIDRDRSFRKGSNLNLTGF